MKPQESTPLDRLMNRINRSGLSLNELMDVYAAGATLLESGEVAPDEMERRIVESVCKRLGIEAESHHLELLGDCINLLVGSSESDTKSRWHLLKVNDLGSRDRTRRILATQLLRTQDFDDDAVLAAFLEAIENDDDVSALTFVESLATGISQNNRNHVIELLVDTLQEMELKRSARAAYPMQAIFRLHEANHLVPDASLMDRVVTIVTNSEDSAAYAGAVELASLEVASVGPGIVVDWLRSGQLRRIALACATLSDTEESLVSASNQKDLCRGLEEALRAVERAEDDFPDSMIEWIKAELCKHRAECD